MNSTLRELLKDPIILIALTLILAGVFLLGGIIL